MNIVYSKKDIMVSVGTEAGKSLIYQVVLLINLGAIILTITSTITLIKDQKREFKQKGISALEFIAVVVTANLNIWKQLEQKEYSVIFASLKTVLAPQSHF